MTTHEKLLAAQGHAQAGRFEEAERLYREVLDAEPRNQYALRALGHLAHQLGRSDLAAQWLELLMQVTPNDPAVYNNLAATYAMLGDTDSALQAFNRALTLDPNHAAYHNNLAMLMRDVGQLDDAIEAYRESIRIDPTPRNAQAWDNLLYLIHFHPDYDPPRIHREHVAWRTAMGEAMEFDVEPHGNERSAERKLRIGYVLPLVRAHAKAAFLLPLIENHDRERFEVTFYSDARGDVTEPYRARVVRWRDTAGISHEQLAALVRDDEIDILIDLNQHIAAGRLEVFARKPAPVQVTCLGYHGTTGLEQIDWRMTDAHLDPRSPGEGDEFYFERSWRLPWSFCYRAMVNAPAVSELPARANGHVTFGCLNSAAKLNGPTLDLWARVMSATPSSRLIVMAAAPTLRRSIADRLAGAGAGTGAGVDEQRIEFVGDLSDEERFELYRRIDVGLSTFPYPGHATTCDALWMGVPVATLTGATATSRLDLSILKAVGLSELIADSPERYVLAVSAVAADLEKLARLRAELRPRMQNSPLCDGVRFTRDFEAALRQMWRQWTQSTPDADK